MNDNYSRNIEMDRISFWFVEPKVSQLPTFVFNLLLFCFVGVESIFFFMQWVMCDASPILTADNSTRQSTNTAVTSFRFVQKFAMYWPLYSRYAYIQPTDIKFRIFVSFFRYNFFWHFAAVAAVDTGGGVDSHSTKLYSISLHRRTLSALLHIVMSLFAIFLHKWKKKERRRKTNSESLLRILWSPCIVGHVIDLIRCRHFLQTYYGLLWSVRPRTFDFIYFVVLCLWVCARKIKKWKERKTSSVYHWVNANQSTTQRTINNQAS